MTSDLKKTLNLLYAGAVVGILILSLWVLPFATDLSFDSISVNIARALGVVAILYLVTRLVDVFVLPYHQKDYAEKV